MGPLNGIRVLEFAGLGALPFAAMMLADMGAEVLRVDRIEGVGDELLASPAYLMHRGRRSVAIDLKNPRGVEAVLRLVENADGLVEGFRPRVMERLGLGPDECQKRNPRLIYGRMTGFGQEGPLAERAGHDINYIAIAGALHSLGRKGEKPTAPLSLVGDFGGGGMLMAFGFVCALLERVRSGKGQVIDAAMVDGSALMMTMIHGIRQAGMWNDERGTNFFDSGSHFYDTYETADGEFISIGAIEPEFYAELLEKTGISDESLPDQYNEGEWSTMKKRFEALFRSKSRDEWCEILDGSDTCFAPVLSIADAPRHAHNQARKSFVDKFGLTQPSPAPRFSRSQPEIVAPSAAPGEHTIAALADWGFADGELEELQEAGAIRQAP